jgi:nitrogenase molybdenum-iron protein beta chain
VLASELQELDLSPEVTVGVDAYGVKQALRRSRPDCVFGSLVDWQLGKELGIPYCFRVISPTGRFHMTDRPYFGYDGLINILEILQNEHQDRWRSRTRRYEAKW